MSDIQDYIDVIIKRHGTLTIPSIHVCIRKINNRSVFKIKDRCNLVLKMNNKITWSHKKINRQKDKKQKKHQVLK